MLHFEHVGLAVAASRCVLWQLSTSQAVCQCTLLSPLCHSHTFVASKPLCAGRITIDLLGWMHWLMKGLFRKKGKVIGWPKTARECAGTPVPETCQQQTAALCLDATSCVERPRLLHQQNSSSSCAEACDTMGWHCSLISLGAHPAERPHKAALHATCCTLYQQ